MAETRWEQFEARVRRQLSDRDPPRATVREIADAAGLSVDEATYTLELLLKRADAETEVTDAGRRVWTLANTDEEAERRSGG